MLLVTDRPSVILDTSAINALYEDPHREMRLRQLRVAYYPLLTFSALDELVAPSDAYKAKQLFDIALSLQSAGNCLLPFNFLMVAHLREYAASPDYDWRRVNCYGDRLREAIVDKRHELTAQLLEEQRNQNRNLERNFKSEFRRVRHVMKDRGISLHPFLTFDDFFDFALGDGGPYWKVAADLIRGAFRVARDEEAAAHHEIREDQSLIEPEVEVTEAYAKGFIAVCPPFKAMLFGNVKTAFTLVHDSALSSKDRDKSAGRVDTNMASYLPYCRFFVTRDAGQLDCFSSVVSKMGSESAVIPYDDFWRELPYR